MASAIQQKRKAYRKSRFGCRNCKLRRIKCDETKPNCRKCKEYGLSCNFFAGTLDLQSSIAGLQTLDSGSQLCIARTIHRPLNLAVICSDGTGSFEMDAQCMNSLERFRLGTLQSFTPKMLEIWRDQIPHIAFRSPYLMHTILAVAAAHERYLHTSIYSTRNRTEAYHSSQSTLLFNQKLSLPIDSSDRDALWATAALLSIMTVASFDAATVEEAWPLRQEDPSDLAWIMLNDGKWAVWKLTNPLRPGGIFRAMAHEYAALHLKLPSFGAEGLAPTLAELCNITASSSRNNNAYFVAAHVLARLQRFSDGHSGGIRMVSFVSQSQAQFRKLLREKDPVALLLLALWYQRAGKVLWWVERRARVEVEAIWRYLEQFHGDDSRFHQLLLLSS